MKGKRILIGMMISLVFIEAVFMMNVDKPKNDFLINQIAVFQTEDGGFGDISNTGDILTDTYVYLDTLNNLNTDITFKKDVQNWLEEYDDETLFTNNVDEAIKQIYLYVGVSEFVDYNLSNDRKQQIVSYFESTQDNNGLIHSPRNDSSSLTLTIYAIETCDKMNKIYPQKEELMEWTYEYIGHVDETENDNLFEYAKIVDIYSHFNIDNKDFKSTVDTYLEQHPLVDEDYENAIYYLSWFDDYLKLMDYANREVSYDHKQKIKIGMEAHRVEDGLYGANYNYDNISESGDIYQTRLITNIYNRLSIDFNKEDMVKEIDNRRLPESVFCDNYFHESDLQSTFYIVESLYEIGGLEDFKENLISYIYKEEEKYEDYNANYQLMILSIKERLDIEDAEDLNRISELINYYNINSFYIEDIFAYDLYHVFVRYGKNDNQLLNDQIKKYIDEITIGMDLESPEAKFYYDGIKYKYYKMMNDPDYKIYKKNIEENIATGILDENEDISYIMYLKYTGYDVSGNEYYIDAREKVEALFEEPFYLENTDFYNFYNDVKFVY